MNNSTVNQTTEISTNLITYLKDEVIIKSKVQLLINIKIM